MITPKLKANAIALLEMGDSPRKVSEDLEVPYMLVMEWAESANLQSLTRLQANAVALSRVMESEVVNSGENVEILKTKIEETAIAIVDKTRLMAEVPYPDLQQSKALELLANTCSKLYLTIVSKSPNPEINKNGMTLLEQLSRD